MEVPLRSFLRKALFLVVSLLVIALVVGVNFKEKKEILRSIAEEKSISFAVPVGRQETRKAKSVQIKTKIITLSPDTVKELDKKLSQNTAKVVVQGKEGVASLSYLVLYLGNKEISRKLVYVKILKEPVDTVIKIGPRSLKLASRGNSRILKMKATAYTPGHNCDTCTAIGLTAKRGVVAVDPRVIPLGTHLHIKGYGHAIAGDTGSAIKGFRIDLCFDTLAEAKAFGRRTVEIELLD